MLELLADPHAWMALATLTALELVLGIDNIIFISILADRLPDEKKELVRRVGLGAAMLMRLGLLFLLSWIVAITTPLFTLPLIKEEISVRDLVFVLGGLFLLWKSVGEIHETLEASQAPQRTLKSGLAIVIVQIMVVDMVFSLDSIITAIGMVDEVAVMVAAVVLSVCLMMLFAGAIGRFVSAHPTIRMLALAFLVVIGVVLIAQGFDHHVPKAYIYSAMTFSLAVEMLNSRLRRNGADETSVAVSYLQDSESKGKGGDRRRCSCSREAAYVFAGLPPCPVRLLPSLRQGGESASSGFIAQSRRMAGYSRRCSATAAVPLFNPWKICQCDFGR